MSRPSPVATDRSFDVDEYLKLMVAVRWGDSVATDPADVAAARVPFNESSPAFRRPSRRLAALRLLTISRAMACRRALPATAMPRRESSANSR